MQDQEQDDLHQAIMDLPDLPRRLVQIQILRQLHHDQALGAYLTRTLDHMPRENMVLLRFAGTGKVYVVHYRVYQSSMGEGTIEHTRVTRKGQKLGKRHWHRTHIRQLSNLNTLLSVKPQKVFMVGVRGDERRTLTYTYARKDGTRFVAAVRQLFA